MAAVARLAKEGMSQTLQTDRVKVLPVCCKFNFLFPWVFHPLSAGYSYPSVVPPRQCSLEL